MQWRKSRRRILKVLAWFLASLVLLVLSLPLWFPVLLRPVARKAGATYSAYERKGYARFKVTNAVYSNGPVLFRAETVEAYTPTAWLVRLAFGSERQPFASAAGWNYTVLTNGVASQATNTTEGSTFTGASDVADVFREVQKWVPTAAATNGTIHVGDIRIPVSNATWNRGALRAEGELPRVGHTLLTGNLKAPNLATVRAVSDSFPGELNAELKLSASDLTAEGTGSWRTKPFSFSTRFGRRGELPEFAELKAPEFTVPTDWLPLTNIGEVAGSVSARWEEGEFKVSAHARSVGGASVWSTNFTVNVEAAGSTNYGRFHVAGSNIGTRELTAREVVVDGMLRWPWLELTNVSAVLPDASACALAGKLDLTNNEIAGGRFEVKGPFARRWLPPGFNYESMVASGKFSGPFTNLTHSGELELTDVVIPALSHSDVRATWEGQSVRSARVQADLQVGSSQVLLKSAIDRTRNGADALIENLAVITNGQTLFALTRPSRVSFSESSQGWTLAVPKLELKGNSELGMDALVHWPYQGNLRIEARNLSTIPFQAFVTNDLEEVEIQALNADVAWSNGPAVFGLDLTGDYRLPLDGTNNVLPASARVQAMGDARGVTISNLLVTSQTSTVATAHGFLPVSLHPADSNALIHFESGQLDFSAESQPEALLWRLLSRSTGLILDGPSLSLQLSGTWDEPHGEAHLRAARVKMPQKIPPVEQVIATLAVEHRQATLSDGKFLIAGQPVTFEGKLPLGDSFWNGLKQKRLPDWRQATADLEVKDATIASLKQWTPEVLSPEGTINLQASLLPEGKLQGELLISHARTRPLGPLGPLRDINLKLEAHDRELTLTEASVQVGGAPVRASGYIDLRGTNWLKGELPQFDIILKGTNVPLARQPEFIVRSDLDLSFVRTNDAPPVLAGTVRLRDSSYLSDLTALAGGKVASPKLRPPYFSVETPPFADWRLALHVEGNRAFRVRSTLFVGEASINLRLEKTLKDPSALGDVKIDSGIVRFPFANLEVKQGIISLTSANPYEPQLLIMATSKQFGYELRMTATGSADAPVLQFSSTPPLSSEQILLLVTAGELPTGNYSLTTQQKAQTFGLFLGRDLLSKLGFGDQTEQRLIVHSAENISDTGKPTYGVEYKLSDRWSVVGERDRFGDFNAGFKWQVYSK